MREQPVVKVGEKVIYVPKRHMRPILTTVARVTPTGQIAIPDTKGSFRRGRYGDEFKQGSKWSDKAAVYLFSDKRLAELNTFADAAEEEKSKQKAEAERKAAEREALDRTQNAEIRRVCNNVLPIQSKEVLPDGSRFYVFNLPLHPEREEKQFDRLIVRTNEAKDFNWHTSEKGTVIAADSTYATARGFVGRSTSRGENEEDLLWALVQDRYFDWS